MQKKRKSIQHASKYEQEIIVPIVAQGSPSAMLVAGFRSVEITRGVNVI